MLAPGIAVTASAASAPPVPTAAAGLSTPVTQLPTSWPAVLDVTQRLQPWLATTLDSAPASEQLRVMVSGETTGAATAAAQAAGLTVQQTWDKVGIVVGVGLPDQVRAVVAQPGVTYVEGDQPLEYHLDTAHEATRSQQALTTYKAPDGGRIDGSGVTIAVIDSGVDGTHPMFADTDGRSKVVQNRKNVCGITIEPSLNDACFRQSPANDTDTVSAGGHGTHVAGIAAGYEVTTTAPAGMALRGAAPGAKLVSLSVGAAIGLLDANAAMNWVVDHQRKPCAAASAQGGELDPECPPIRATNHSYGPATAPEGGFEFDPNSATVRIQRMLVGQGVTPVWAAGNSGGDGTIAQTNPPAMDPTPGVLMVASYNDGQTGNRDNQLSGFSSRGAKGKTGTYPDLSAPGDGITSACRPTLLICRGAPSYDLGNYQTISGTSMATPYVAGVVAQLAQANPAVTPGQGEDLLEDNAHKFTAGAMYEGDPLNTDDITSFDKGHGLVDVAATLAAQQGLPAPGVPAPKCTASSRQVVDSAGDATQFVIVDTPAPSQADLDIREGWLTWDGVAKELTFHITVTDLSANPTGDEYFRFYVTRESDAEVYAVANRDAAGENFSVKQFDARTTTTVTGSFDEETNEITIVLPAAQYAEVVPEATLAEGNTIGVGQILGQRDTGVITATADTAAGSCPYTVKQATVTTTPSPSGSASPSPSGSAAPSPSGSGSPSPSPSGSGSPSPSPSGSASPSPSGSASPSPSPSGSASPSPSPRAGTVRSLDSACPEGKVPPNSHTDDDTNTHERAIECMVWWEIAKGQTDTRYAPSAGVSREQMASFVARLVEKAGGRLPANPRNAFSDDDTSHHHASINKLAEAGLVDGKGGGRFAPKETVSRAQMAKFIVNAYEFVSPKTITASRDYFSDDDGDTLESFINTSAEAGFTAGRNGKYEPRQPVLRDQMASFLARTLDLLVAEGTTPAKK